jgi:protein-tyrosine phosphatase
MKEIESGKYPFVRGENCLPIPVELTWRDENPAGKTYTVTVSVNRDLSEGVQLTATSCKASIKDLQVGQTYYWQVTDGTETSQLFTFTTADDYPRFFELEGVSNFRDVGGYMTKDGKRVKRGVMYRSAYLNEASAEAKDYMVNTLGIRMELDLRGSGAPTFGKEVSRRVIAMQWYTHIFTESNAEVVRQTISAFADPASYPMNFHCAVGRDRTGTTAFLILGLLGVEEDTLLREYYSSFFSRSGSCPRDEFILHVRNIHDLMDRLNRYAPKGTLQDQIEAYLLSVGVTEAEIASIRENLLEEP